MTSTKIRFGKFGLAENPVGLHVKMDYQGRTYLGDVRQVRRDETTGCCLLSVTHFNGEAWPIEPAASFVDVI